MSHVFASRCRLVYKNMSEMIPNKTFIEREFTSEDGVTTIRANLETKEDALAWIHTYSEKTNTQWIVSNNSTASGSGVRRVFRKMWVCQHHVQNKCKQRSKRNENCMASINIKIKKLTKGTLRKDSFLREVPPLQAVITIKTQHTHPLSIESLQYLRADDAVRKVFEGYFESGMAPSESHKHHESILSLEENSAEIIANRRKNPSERTVRHFFDVWKRRKNGSKTAVYEHVKSKIEDYKNQGVDVFVSESKESQLWAILVVTPAMRRTHATKPCKIIHVATVAPKRAVSCSVTFLLRDTPIGPIPVGVLIHETQKIPGYEAAFKLLKENFEYCFGGKRVPKYFITDNITAQKVALRTVWPGTIHLLCRFRLEQAEWTWLNKPKSAVPPGVRRSFLNYFKKIMHANSTVELLTAESLFCDNVGHDGYRRRMENMMSESLKEEWILMYRPDSIRIPSFDNFSKATIGVLRDLLPNRSASFNPVALVDSASRWEQYFGGGVLHVQKARKSNGPVRFTTEVDTIEVDTIEVDTIEVDTIEVDSAEVDPIEVYTKVEISELDTAEVDPIEVDPIEVDTADVDPIEVGTAEVDPIEVDTAKVDSIEVDTAEVDPIEVDCVEVDTCDVGHPFSKNVEVQELNVENNPPSPSCFVDVSNVVTNNRALKPQEDESCRLKITKLVEFELVWVPADAPRISDDKILDKVNVGGRFDKSALLEEMERVLDLANEDVLEEEGSKLLKRLRAIGREKDATDALLQMSSLVKKRRME